MDYKEKYKRAIERAKKLYEQGTITESLGFVFPELKETEDERIRKAIKKALQVRCDGSRIISDEPVTLEEAIAWLEKQGKHNPTDKPKFKVRDWIVDKSGHIQQVLDFRGGIYTCTHNSFTIDCESNYHLWTIEDAKDGDVLVHNGCPFIFMGIKDGIVQALEENLLEGTNPVNFGEPKIDKDYQPATKEQRAMLFHKMKEEGYEWDADKKELKKIEPKKLDANKVIAWLIANICDFEYYVKLFKKDFGL